MTLPYFEHLSDTHSNLTQEHCQHCRPIVPNFPKSPLAPARKSSVLQRYSTASLLPPLFLPQVFGHGWKCLPVQFQTSHLLEANPCSFLSEKLRCDLLQETYCHSQGLGLSKAPSASCASASMAPTPIRHTPHLSLLPTGLEALREQGLRPVSLP